MSKAWPYHADGETVRDYHGEFVAAADTEQDARFLSAAPALYLYHRAAEGVFDELRQNKDFNGLLENKLDGVRGEIQKALAGWRTT